MNRDWSYAITLAVIVAVMLFGIFTALHPVPVPLFPIGAP